MSDKNKVCKDLRHVCGGCGFQWPERAAYDELILENARLREEVATERARIALALVDLREIDTMTVVIFYYYDSCFGKYWPGPEGHSGETERFLAARIPPKVVLWRNKHWVLDTVLIDAQSSHVVVHYVRATFDRAQDGYRADDP